MALAAATGRHPDVGKRGLAWKLAQVILDLRPAAHGSADHDAFCLCHNRNVLQRAPHVHAHGGAALARAGESRGGQLRSELD